MEDLISEQKNTFNKLCKIKNEELFYRKNNFILLGEAGSGKTKLLKSLGLKKGFKYVNFTKEILREFINDYNISVRYLNSNDFFKFIEKKFGFNSSFTLIDSIEPIIISLYNNNERKLLQFFNNLFEQQTNGGLLLSITKYKMINFDSIIEKSKLENKNIFKLNDKEGVTNRLRESYNLPKYRVDTFKNNHYFKLYRSDSE